MEVIGSKTSGGWDSQPVVSQSKLPHSTWAGSRLQCSSGALTNKEMTVSPHLPTVPEVFRTPMHWEGGDWKSGVYWSTPIQHGVMGGWGLCCPLLVHLVLGPGPTTLCFCAGPWVQLQRAPEHEGREHCWSQDPLLPASALDPRSHSALCLCAGSWDLLQRHWLMQDKLWWVFKLRPKISWMTSSWFETQVCTTVYI